MNVTIDDRYRNVDLFWIVQRSYRVDEGDRDVCPDSTSDDRDDPNCYESTDRFLIEGGYLLSSLVMFLKQFISLTVANFSTCMARPSCQRSKYRLLFLSSNQREDYEITLTFEDLTFEDIKSPNAIVMQYEDAAGRRRTEFQFVPKRKPVKFSGGWAGFILCQASIRILL